MIRSNRFAITWMGTLLLALAGCSQHQGRFALLAPNLAPIEDVEQVARDAASTRVRRVHGTDSRSFWLTIPGLTAGFPVHAAEIKWPSLTIAIQNALADCEGAIALRDADVYTWAWGIPFLYGEYGWEVEGFPVLLAPGEPKDP